MGKRGWKYQDFSGEQRHNYHSDLNWKLFLVTYYKVTSLNTLPRIILSEFNNEIEKLRKPCPICTKTNYTYWRDYNDILIVSILWKKVLPTWFSTVFGTFSHSNKNIHTIHIEHETCKVCRRDPREGAGGLSREYVLRIPSVHVYDWNIVACDVKHQ